MFEYFKKKMEEISEKVENVVVDIVDVAGSILDWILELFLIISCPIWIIPFKIYKYVQKENENE